MSSRILWLENTLVDRYAKFATDNLSAAAAGIEASRCKAVSEIGTFLTQWRKQTSDEAT